MSYDPLIAIVGPTASGKSALALKIAQEYNGEIICADSRTVYKGMDIGTAKPSKQDQKLIKHHLIDVVEPNQKFSAADFKQRAEKAIETIIKRGKIPIMVGGTGLYINAILFDYAFRTPSTDEVRIVLDKFTTLELQEMCREKNIDITTVNRRHLIRALETEQTGTMDERQLRPNTLVLGLSIEQSILHRRIIRRIENMLKQGVITEAQGLAKHYGWDNESMTGNIYGVMHKVQQKNVTLSLALEEAIRRDMQLAKRQMTWFRRNPFIIWGNPSELITKVAQFIKTLS